MVKILAQSTDWHVAAATASLLHPFADANKWCSYEKVQYANLHLSTSEQWLHVCLSLSGSTTLSQKLLNQLSYTAM